MVHSWAICGAYSASGSPSSDALRSASSFRLSMPVAEVHRWRGMAVLASPVGAPAWHSRSPTSSAVTYPLAARLRLMCASALAMVYWSYVIEFFRRARRMLIYVSRETTNTIHAMPVFTLYN